MIRRASGLTVIGDGMAGSIGYWYRETSNFPSNHRNNDVISEDEIIEVSAGDGIHGHTYLETIHSSSCNRGVYHISDNGRGGYISQYNRKSSSFNNGAYNLGDDYRGESRS